MRRLVVTADDYGYTKAINEGIVRAAKEGIVTDIAVMVLTDQSDLAHGLSLLKSHGLSEVGLHTSLFPWSKTNRPQRADFIDFFKHGSDEDLRSKAMAEIAQFERIFGHPPKFISPQFNMHGNLRLLKVMAEYVVSRNIPMRIPRALIESEEVSDNNYSAEVYLKRLGVKMTDHLFAHILGADANKIKATFLSELKSVNDGQSVEIILHPGYHDQDTLESSSLNFERSRDLAIALDQNFKEKILQLDYQFTHLSQI